REVRQVADDHALALPRVGGGDAVVEAEVEAVAQVRPQRRAHAPGRAGDQHQGPLTRRGHPRAPRAPARGWSVAVTAGPRRATVAARVRPHTEEPRPRRRLTPPATPHRLHGEHDAGSRLAAARRGGTREDTGPWTSDPSTSSGDRR